MDLKLFKEEISTIEEILNTNCEQAVELDYVLPDYYPEIHKIIKCTAEPHVISRCVSDSTLSYDIALLVKILYCSENSSKINVIDQKLIYTKNTDLPHNTANPDIKINARTDYINCRAINSRRVDLRGALSIEISVTDISSSQLISDAEGMGIQLHKIPVTYPSNRLFASKQFVIEEEFELGQSNLPVDNIIYVDTAIISSDKKIIANKLVAKGEVNINVLYTSKSADECGIENIQFTIPFSQIIDMDGIDENFECQIESDIITSEVAVRSDGDGKSDNIVCKLTMLVKCHAYRITASELAVDQYSVIYSSNSVKTELDINNIVKNINNTSVIKSHLDFTSDLPECIYDVRCKLRNCTAFVNECDVLTVNGTADYSVLACNADKNPFIYDKSESFTVNIPYDNLNEKCTAEINVCPLSCSYNIVSDNQADVVTEINISGVINCVESISGLTDIEIAEEHANTEKDDCAIKLYFAQDGEKIWDIAKRYRASINSVIEENDLNGDNIINNGMLIIPMT